MNTRLRSWAPLLFLLFVAGVRFDLPGIELSEIDSSFLFDPVSPSEPGADLSSGELWRIPSGPWGALEAYNITLEPPDAYVELTMETYQKPEAGAWIFGRMTREKVRAGLLDSGMDARTADALLSPPFLEESGDGVLLIRPPAEVVEALAAETRKHLYPLLGNGSPSDPFSNPFGIYRSGFEKMAVGSALSEKTVDAISRLCYPRYGSIHFSDIHLVFQRTADEAERHRILKTLFRQRSLVVRLWVSPSADLPGIAEYWSAKGQNRDSLPILESVRHTDQVEKLDIVHLLPPTPRKLLNTYPRPLMSLGMTPPDCFWSSLNFFDYEPSERHFDPDNISALLSDSFEKVTKPLDFGDTILIWNKADGKPIHACNYIAGDIVFTKDGQSFNRPWVLSRFQDVVGRYLVADQVVISFYRKRP